MQKITFSLLAALLVLPLPVPAAPPVIDLDRLPAELVRMADLDRSAWEREDGSLAASRFVCVLQEAPADAEGPDEQCEGAVLVRRPDGAVLTVKVLAFSRDRRLLGAAADLHEFEPADVTARLTAWLGTQCPNSSEPSAWFIEGSRVRAVAYLPARRRIPPLLAVITDAVWDSTLEKERQDCLGNDR